MYVRSLMVGHHLLSLSGWPMAIHAAAVVVVLLLVGVHVLRTIYCRFYTYYSGVLPYVSQQEERCKAARYEY